MQSGDYYCRTNDRSDEWSIHSADPGFSPNKALMAAARPFLAKGGSVLDIGCQGGHQLALVREDYKEAVGVDIANYGPMWSLFPDVEFLVHDVDTSPLPFAEQHFDCIICTAVLEHVFDVFGLMREISRVLRPSGTLLLAVPNLGFYRHVVDLLRGRVPRTGASIYPFGEKDGWDGQHLHYFTPKELTFLMCLFNIRTTHSLHPGRLRWLKRILPSLLDSGICLIGEKS
jgi:SAM-dependent methyltransferase